MRKAGALLLAAALTGTIAASAGARPSALLQLPLNGTAKIVGTHIVCGAGHSNGQTFIDCGIPGSKGLQKKGSYVALIGANGKVSIATTSKIVFNRIAGTMQREASVIQVHSGDVFEIPGVSTILCSVTPVSGKLTVFCDRLTKKGKTQPDSYAFGMSDTVVTALGWDTKGKVHVLESWPENG